MLKHGSLARWLTAAAAMAAAALPATAMADSIAYVKDGNVWLTEPDGSRQLQVTSDGGWTGASQSENGVIVGAKNRRLYRLARAGGVQNEIVTAMQSLNWNGPYDIDVSPDGTRVAYGYLYQHIVTDPTCPGTPSQCSSSSVFSGVAYSNTDGPASGVPSHTGWSYPAWVGDDLLLHSYADGFLNKETILRPFGSSNSDGDQWFTHPAIPRMYDATVRDGTLAFVGPDNGQLLSVLHVNGAPSATATTDDCFAYGQPTGKFASPTLAPGTRAMAWAENDGIWRGDFENPSDGCDGAPQIGHMIVPGGKSPDWGPADVPPAPDPGTKDPARSSRRRHRPPWSSR